MTDFWSRQRVLITGHTGFKGAWLSEQLLMKGANVFGAALPPEGPDDLFVRLDHENRLDHRIVDIRDHAALRARLDEAQPDVIIHMAACSLVRRSYRDPLETWRTNLLGSVNLMEALRETGAMCAVVMVTTDKVYANAETGESFEESDRLGGNDPYSASKAASELAVHSYRQSFFTDGGARLATARAGNVIGGGDYAEDRIVPDLVRALAAKKTLKLRNPSSIRPWQHVLDPLAGYLRLAEALTKPETNQFQRAFNFGPAKDDRRSVSDLVEVALKQWPGDVETAPSSSSLPESKTLRLNAELALDLLEWRPRWSFERAVTETIDWYHQVHEGVDPVTLTQNQILAYEAQT
ncbi:MAG: CDP-glucose 4,6-dehydratase [Oceanicaulis sp.]|uniref:CDP-glucose 4,6-dehydratase n=1 Tax=Oceanicaulis sp. UBA2681 TaxID=1947007 RepID=UPI000C090B9A|nr:CDP-glucose 4,6-dehydratase [Oceanicaulis sp. UBA2681]MAP49202.1 CDP-glucose 4,6-dehydratase [Oceanicaulis sp.]|tara:strand:+ start:1724 stop:2776 length:1053 start_codon:yes stop_codon:yes gene_type:complete